MNKIYIRNLQRKLKVDSKGYRRLLSQAMKELSIDNSEITLIYCNKEKIRYLNDVYRDIDSSTDVLSFEDGDIEENGNVYLGEIFICPEVAFENSQYYGVRFVKEMADLHVHGLLHLLGYDHEKDSGEMMSLQRQIINKLRSFIDDISCKSL